METRIWKRLGELEHSFSPQHYCATFTQSDGESDEECQARIARWRVGDGTDDKGRKYTGKEHKIFILQFVDPRNRRE